MNRDSSLRQLALVLGHEQFECLPVAPLCPFDQLLVYLTVTHLARLPEKLTKKRELRRARGSSIALPAPFRNRATGYEATDNLPLALVHRRDGLSSRGHARLRKTGICSPSRQRQRSQTRSRRKPSASTLSAGDENVTRPTPGFRPQVEHREKRGYEARPGDTVSAPEPRTRADGHGAVIDHAPARSTHRASVRSACRRTTQAR